MNRFGIASPRRQAFMTPEDRAATKERGFRFALNIADTLGELLELEQTAPIFTRDKHEPFPDCRFVIWSILYCHGYSLCDIGRIFERDHTSILHGVRTCASRCATEPEYGRVYAKVKELFT